MLFVSFASGTRSLSFKTSNLNTHTTAVIIRRTEPRLNLFANIFLMFLSKIACKTAKMITAERIYIMYEMPKLPPAADPVSPPTPSARTIVM